MRPDPALETWTGTTGYPRLAVSCEKCTPTVAVGGCSSLSQRAWLTGVVQLVAEIPIMRLSRPKPAAIMDVRRGQVPPPGRARAVAVWPSALPAARFWKPASEAPPLFPGCNLSRANLASSPFDARADATCMAVTFCLNHNWQRPRAETERQSHNKCITAHHTNFQP